MVENWSICSEEGSPGLVKIDVAVATNAKLCVVHVIPTFRFYLRMYDCESFYRHPKESSRPRFFLTVGSHPQTSTLCQSMQRSREIICSVCVEVSGGIYLPEMKPVLKRIHRGISERSDISYSAAETRVHQRLSFTLQRSNAYSISLQSTAATRGSWIR